MEGLRAPIAIPCFCRNSENNENSAILAVPEYVWMDRNSAILRTALFSLHPNIPLELPQCSRLCVLELDECPEVKSVSSIWLRKFQENRLDMLYLSCTSWTYLPTDLGTFGRLGTLWVSECYNLTSFPDELARVRVDTLIINVCLMVKELPEGLDRMLSSLKKLTISKCPELERFCKEGPYSAIISQFGTTS